MNNFILKVVAPDKIAIKDYNCSGVLIPTYDGPAMILQNHTHYIVSLNAGIVYCLGDVDNFKIFVNKGVCKVIGQEIIILTNECCAASDIELDIIEQEASELIKKMNVKNYLSLDDYNYLNEKLKVNQVKQELMKK